MHLVDASQFSEYIPGVLRLLVEPKLANSLVVPHGPRHAVTHARVTGMELFDDKLQDSNSNISQADTDRQQTGLLCNGCRHKGQVVLADGSTMPFHVLVVCCGTGYCEPIKHSVGPMNCDSQVGNGQEPGPVLGGPTSLESQGAAHMHTAEQRILDLHTAAAQLKSASTVVIVGGGTVGVELAAEVAGTYGRSKQVTLVTADSRLVLGNKSAHNPQ